MISAFTGGPAVIVGPSGETLQVGVVSGGFDRELSCLVNYASVCFFIRLNFSNSNKSCGGWFRNPN